MSIQNEADWRPAPVTNRQIKFATVLAFFAWAFAVYDFILFGTLLPEIGRDLGLDAAEQAELITWMAIGAVLLGLLAGPVVDKFGRKAGMAFTTAGAGIASALTALAAESLSTAMVSTPATSICVPGVVSRFRENFARPNGSPSASTTSRPGQLKVNVARSSSFLTGPI